MYAQYKIYDRGSESIWRRFHKWHNNFLSPIEHPKGVMISYQNLLHNFELMEESYSTDSLTVELCLLPHYNGYALVGSYLHSLYVGATAYFITPEIFFRNPTIWIKAMHEFKVTHAKVPGCAFFDSIHVQPRSYVLKNLLSVRCIACIEPVQIQDLRNFEKYMSKFGLRKNTISIGYGLAEHVALVSTTRYDSNKEVVQMKRFACGSLGSKVAVKIVDPQHKRNTSGLGEVWLSSKSKALGYFKDELKTKEVFEAQIHSSSEGDLYLRTGDIGFVQGNKLFICEKFEDFLTLEGETCFLDTDRTFFPTDIENVIESTMAAIRRGTTIVIKHRTIWCTDKISVLAELRSADYSTEQCDAFTSEIIKNVAEYFDVVTSGVFFFRPLTMPFTTFGKRQRSKSLTHRMRGMEEVKMYEWQDIGKEEAKSMRRSTPATVKSLTPTSQGTTPLSQGGFSQEGEKSLLSSVQEEMVATLDPAPMGFIPAPQGGASPVSKHSGSPLTSPQGRSFPLAKGKQQKPPPPSPPPQMKPAPLADGRFSLLPGMYPPGTIGIKPRRVSVPVSPFSNKPPRSMRRVQSESLLSGASGMNKMLQVLRRVTGQDIGPNEKIWEVGSPVVDEMSRIMKEEYGFCIDKGTILMAESPIALLKLMKISLLNTDKLNCLTDSTESSQLRTAKPWLQSLAECLPHYDYFLSRVLRSESRVYVNEVEEFQHSETDIAIIGVGGSFAGQFLFCIPDPVNYK